jgi:hypothetical protein
MYLHLTQSAEDEDEEIPSDEVNTLVAEVRSLRRQQYINLT